MSQVSREEIRECFATLEKLACANLGLAFSVPQPTDADEELEGPLSKQEVANYLDKTVRTITNWQDKGKFPLPDIDTIGGYPTFSTELIEGWIDAKDKAAFTKKWNRRSD